MVRVMGNVFESRISRLILAMFLGSALLAGCSSAPQQSVTREPSVVPVGLKKISSSAVDSGGALADLLLEHYLKAPAYRMSNPLMLAGYTSGESLLSSDGKQLVKLYQSASEWGFVSISTGYSPVINLFEIFDGETDRYALVIKDAKICLVEGADRAPQWNGAQLRHSTVQPGKFECSGNTRTSLFQPYSGMPNRLGIYFESGDTVLYDSNRQRLERIAALMAQRFNHISLAEAI